MKTSWWEVVAVFAVVVVAILIFRAVANSDLPDWLKFGIIFGG